MTEENPPHGTIRALGLLSGGLDSTLAARLLMEQNIEVACVNFYTGFCIQSHTAAMRNPKPDTPPPRHDALHAADKLGIKLHMVDISEEYVDIVTNPRYGYGANLNPCLDCKIFMVKKAWELKEQLGYHFLFTGEVIGQRPMSQRKDTMPVVSKRAGVTGWLLRPLSAKLLPETEPELRGWVNREKLMGFSGRTRKPQMALAARLGVTDYPSPAGGCCFLTDENYARRLSDLWRWRGYKQYSLDDIVLLKAGRQLRPAENFKVIVGRDESENMFLSGFKHGRVAIQSPDIPGPLVLVEGMPTDADITLACRLTARFGKGKTLPEMELEVQRDGQTEIRRVIPLRENEVPESWYL